MKLTVLQGINNIPWVANNHITTETNILSQAHYFTWADFLFDVSVYISAFLSKHNYWNVRNYLCSTLSDFIIPIFYLCNNCLINFSAWIWNYLHQSNKNYFMLGLLQIEFAREIYSICLYSTKICYRRLRFWKKGKIKDHEVNYENKYSKWQLRNSKKKPKMVRLKLKAKLELAFGDTGHVPPFRDS